MMRVMRFLAGLFLPALSQEINCAGVYSEGRKRYSRISRNLFAIGSVPASDSDIRLTGISGLLVCCNDSAQKRLILRHTYKSCKRNRNSAQGVTTMTVRPLETLYSVEEAAKKLGGVSKYTIYAWLSRGTLERT